MLGMISTPLPTSSVPSLPQGRGLFQGGLLLTRGHGMGQAWAFTKGFCVGAEGFWEWISQWVIL